ncbi:hypothetical protein IAU59_002033 [Kwoniella sp. CBS 9459]
MPKRLTGLAKLEASGITPRAMSDAKIKAHEHKFKLFNDFLTAKYPKGIIVNTQTVSSIQHWIELGLPFPNEEIIWEFLCYYADTTKGKTKENGGMIKRSTMEDSWKTLISAWNYAAEDDNQVPEELRQNSMERIEDIVEPVSSASDKPKDVNASEDSR